MAKVTAKEGNRSVQCPYAKNGNIGHQKTAKKKFEKISTCTNEKALGGIFEDE